MEFMLGNVSATTVKEAIIDYSVTDNNLPFSEYIARSRAIIEERRTDLHQPGINAKHIIDANSPYELYPPRPIMSGNRLKYGALLMHGLLDSPFSLRDIGNRLQANGILCRAILLPGHGTIPSDLLSVSYQNWIQALHYGVESLRKEVDQLYLIGYSTGAALSVYQALQDPKISGIILLAPAIRIKAPIHIIVGWHYLKKWLRHNDNNQWLHTENEVDYSKYLSIAFHPIAQVELLIHTLKKLKQNRSIDCPVFMAVSREDETISSHRAIDFFTNLPSPDNKLLLYTSIDRAYPDPRILTRITHYPDLHINHFSHVSIPFAPDNPHYGQNGDYEYASCSHLNNCTYGAYNPIEVDAYDLLHKFKLIKNKRRQLTYNPDFDFTASQIVKFIIRKSMC
ncbi:MAG: alpha/beta fold hydrolase [Gammaproteobacteria bacterium]|nr:alpha/beta fold hydrolase [Gammaproteobacteria bacterium]MCW5582663.1 alpha/beta fold hydrolase [Gammaproteobacteria bacterium]